MQLIILLQVAIIILHMILLIRVIIVPMPVFILINQLCLIIMPPIIHPNVH